MFSWENLENAKQSYDKLVARVASLKAEGEVDAGAFERGKEIFRTALDNDLNTSLAVTAIYDVFKLDTNDATKLALVNDFDKVLGLDLVAHAEAYNSLKADTGVSDELDAYIRAKIAERAAAKKERNFALADAIRDELLSKGITLIDKREGTEYTIS